ncbi:hypothetical protein D9M72_567630 [compost metagenome]
MAVKVCGDAGSAAAAAGAAAASVLWAYAVAAAPDRTTALTARANFFMDFFSFFLGWLGFRLLDFGEAGAITTATAVPADRNLPDRRPAPAAPVTQAALQSALHQSQIP